MRFAAGANPKINFRNGGSAQGLWQGAGGRPIPFGLGLLTQHSQRSLAAPAFPKRFRWNCLGGGPGAMARLRCQSYQAKVDGHWPGGSSWQTGHFASAIWKFLLGFALITWTYSGNAAVNWHGS
jgi:hypothetical protein